MERMGVQSILHVKVTVHINTMLNFDSVLTDSVTVTLHVNRA